MLFTKDLILGAEVGFIREGFILDSTDTASADAAPVVGTDEFSNLGAVENFEPRFSYRNVIEKFSMPPGGGPFRRRARVPIGGQFSLAVALQEKSALAMELLFGSASEITSASPNMVPGAQTDFVRGWLHFVSYDLQAAQGTKVAEFLIWCELSIENYQFNGESDPTLALVVTQLYSDQESGTLSNLFPQP